MCVHITNMEEGRDTGASVCAGEGVTTWSVYTHVTSGTPSLPPQTQIWMTLCISQTSSQTFTPYTYTECVMKKASLTQTGKVCRLHGPGVIYTSQSKVKGYRSKVVKNSKFDDIFLEMYNLASPRNYTRLASQLLSYRYIQRQTTSPKADNHRELYCHLSRLWRRCSTACYSTICEVPSTQASNQPWTKPAPMVTQIIVLRWITEDRGEEEQSPLQYIAER